MHNYFLLSLYNYVYFNIDSGDKTKIFFQNIIDIDFMIKDDKYEKNLDTILKNLRNEDSALHTSSEEKFLEFMKYLAEQYTKFIGSNENIDFLLKNKSLKDIKFENETVVNHNYNYKVTIPRVFMWISIFVIAVQVFLFFSEGIGNLPFFIISIIVALIFGGQVSSGKSEREMTCNKCNQWNSLKIIKDEIIDSDIALRTESYYEGTGNNSYRRERQYTVRVEVHQYTCKCENCNNIEMKYEKKEVRI